MKNRWLTLAGITGGVFLVLTLVTLIAPSLTRELDLVVARMLIPFQTFSWIQVFLAVTELGGTLGVILIALVAAYFLRKHRHLLVRFAFILASTTIAVNLIKILVSRARPDTLLWFDPLLTYSFPSGHAAASTALYGFLAIASARLCTGLKRTLCIGACLGIILLVGLSRLMLSAHYLSDVIGGYIVALTFIALAFSFRR